jgi:hypothetical protein
LQVASCKLQATIAHALRTTQYPISNTQYSLAVNKTLTQIEWGQVVL